MLFTYESWHYRILLAIHFCCLCNIFYVTEKKNTSFLVPQKNEVTTFGCIKEGTE